MATLKSIKNKYLTASDGTVLGVTTNTENVSLLSLKLATADSLSKFNLVDGFADDYNDATGVDASGSTNEVRDSSGKYYYGEGVGTPTVSGNYDSSAVDGDYTYYKWTTVTSSGSYTTDTAQDYEYLVVAGGGGAGGGDPSGGGGGAGGFRTATGFAVAATTIGSITVGAGGNAVTPGSDSVFSTITSTGGGGGANNGFPADTGGSGGGGNGGTGANAVTGAAGNTPSTSPAQGFPGGSSTTGSTHGGAGGGGASVAGTDASPSHNGSAGGAGTASSITGSAVTYAGGGGGGSEGGNDFGGAGGVGGGGKGGDSNDPGTAGTANTGGGGGGGAKAGSTPGGVGGSGIVIIRRPTTGLVPGANLTLASNAYTAQAAPTTARIIMDEYTSTGSATLNTDIKAYASRDNGTTYTQITLADQGTIETTHRLLSGSVDVSGQPAGSSVKYKIETLNQSASKITRIYGTSMAWA